jgi:hypothetical protein
MKKLKFKAGIAEYWIVVGFDSQSSWTVEGIVTQIPSGFSEGDTGVYQDEEGSTILVPVKQGYRNMDAEFGENNEV